MKIIDSNILVNTANAASAHHSVCKTWLDSVLGGVEEVGFSWVTIGGFIRIVTHPRIFVVPLTTAAAISQVDLWLAAQQARIVEPTSRHWEIFKQLLSAVGTAGNLTTDAHMAALAISHNATLVSCDSDFARFPGLKWENPLKP